jgi:MFS family permease
MTALSGFAQNFTHLLLARIGVGIGEAGGSPPAHAMISDYYAPRERATALSIYSTGVHIGVLIGFLAGGFLGQWLGWRAAFMAVGIPGVIFAGIFFLTVHEPERGRWETSAQASYKPSLGETFRVLAGYRSFWYLAAGAGLTAFAGYGNGNFTPSFLIRSHGLASCSRSLAVGEGCSARCSGAISPTASASPTSAGICGFPRSRAGWRCRSPSPTSCWIRPGW